MAGAFRESSGRDSLSVPVKIDGAIAHGSISRLVAVSPSRGVDLEARVSRVCSFNFVLAQFIEVSHL
jgi:hypothetical protein